MVPEMPAVEVERSKKTSVLVLKQMFFQLFNFDSWYFWNHCALGVQRRYVPHFKGLISAKVELEAQGRESTFTFCHALWNKAILHL